MAAPWVHYLLQPNLEFYPNQHDKESDIYPEWAGAVSVLSVEAVLFRQPRYPKLYLLISRVLPRPLLCHGETLALKVDGRPLAADPTLIFLEVVLLMRASEILARLHREELHLLISHRDPLELPMDHCHSYPARDADSDSKNRRLLFILHLCPRCSRIFALLSVSEASREERRQKIQLWEVSQGRECNKETHESTWHPG